MGRFLDEIRKKPKGMSKSGWNIGVGVTKSLMRGKEALNYIIGRIGRGSIVFSGKSSGVGSKKD